MKMKINNKVLQIFCFAVLGMFVLGSCANDNIKIVEINNEEEKGPVSQKREVKIFTEEQEFFTSSEEIESVVHEVPEEGSSTDSEEKPDWNGVLQYAMAHQWFDLLVNPIEK